MLPPLMVGTLGRSIPLQMMGGCRKGVASTYGGYIRKVDPSANDGWM